MDDVPGMSRKFGRMSSDGSRSAHFANARTKPARIASRLSLRSLAANLSWSCLLCVLCLLRLGRVRIRSWNIHTIVEVASRNYLTHLI